MKHPQSRIIVPICIAIFLGAIMTAPTGAFQRSTKFKHGDIESNLGGYINRPASIATPSPTAAPSDSPGDPSVGTQPEGATGDTIRKRVLGTTIAGAVSAAVSLLLLWVYNLLRDPVHRHRASTRIRQLRREERRERARRRRTE